MTDIMTDIRGYGWNIRDANQAVARRENLDAALKKRAQGPNQLVGLRSRVH